MAKDHAPAALLRDADLPLHKLTRDQLSAFLHLAFMPDELLGLLKQAGVTLQGGYRLETLDDVARGDGLADEITAVPKARAGAVALLKKVYEFPALEAIDLPATLARELALLAAEPVGSVLLFWRLLADPRPELQQAAAAGLDAVADQLFAEPEPGETEEDGPANSVPSGPTAGSPSAEMDRLRKESHAAQSEARRVQKKISTLKEQLKEARAEVVRVSGEAAAQARARETVAAALEPTRGQLTTLQRQEGVADTARLQKERVELASRVATLDERLKDAALERTRLEAALATAQRQAEGARARPTEAPPAAEAVDGDDLPATWLLPRYTKEFYASLEGWEPRIQRAAFKQAHLLAENHRHPSLRAIPLEGLPNYYRVRIATDVRLIYRRGDTDREIEVLSLIDREDLDRYIRQAKTR